MLAIQSASPSLILVRAPITPDLVPELSCPACGGPVDVLQPDVAQPHRLLGVCLECETWTLISIAPDGQEALLALLPSCDSLLSLAESSDLVE